MKTSTFDTKSMNNRKIRVLTTIDPFWVISFYFPNVLVNDHVILSLKKITEKAFVATKS